MTVTHEIIGLICTLAEEEKLKVTVKECLKAGVITGVSAVTGGLLLGSGGFAVAGAVGGTLASYLTRGKFLPAVQVIATMQPEQLSLLADKVRRIMNNFDVTDLAMFAAMITGDFAVRKRVLETVVDHLRSELNFATNRH